MKHGSVESWSCRLVAPRVLCEAVHDMGEDAMAAHIEPVRLAASAADYARFNLAEGQVETWEDGLRLDTAAPNIEWWYFDCRLDDGASLAVIFCTKDASRPHQPLQPLIEIDLDLPDGRRLMKYGRFKAADFEASKDGCDVRIGEYRFTGDLHEYHITGAAEDLTAEVRLEGTTQPWRPQTGHLLFGADGETIFAWTPFVPFGKVTATYRIGSEVHHATGTGYHDHNWMNKQMDHLIDHWWWAKGQVGPYTFVTAHLVAAKKYGYTPLEWFMLARDGKVIAGDSTKVTFSESGTQTDEHTGRPIPDQMSFGYRDGDTRYLLAYARHKTLVSQTVADYTSGLQKLVAEIIRYPLRYLRFSALVSLDRYQGDERSEHQEGPGVFEQMSFARHIHDEQMRPA